MKQELLYPLQEAVLARLQAMGDPQFNQSKLCGGTALSRCWMGHRLSYDLDFFLPHGFKAADMAAALKKSGIAYETKDIVDDPRKANQLHGYVLHGGQRLKVSFVEDAYFETFPSVDMPFGSLTVRTEEIPGLYHRKLRTVAGSDAEGDSFEGGRQKARDLFDLHVLSSSFMPLRDFMAALPYSFPSDAFDNGLANMPWLELMDELGEIVCDPKWNRAKDVSFLQDALYAQIGASAVLDDILREAEYETEPEPPAPPQGKRRRAPDRGGPTR
ncbi:MAG: nucleotidyl transferase AbiEii/AbiGii toxin family protein [Dechloromonas sp.]|nr:nucleotidyl transferase AbiEii/AbiGii toxin family protein [Dechloromonas sp.]